MRLRADDIAVERGGQRLISHLSFALEAGQALVVTGPNGSGKSTLLRALAGLLPLAEGALSHEGGGREASLGENAHYLGHSNALKDALTARENLAFWAATLAADGGAPGESPEAALERVGLPHVADLPVGALSAGQKRRVALARLLVAARPLWLLDEPTAALDQAAQRRCGEILRAHLAGGGLIVAATHADLGLAGARELRLGDERSAA